MPTYGSDTDANVLLPSLLGGVTFPLPTVDLNDPSLAVPPATGALYGAITSLTNEDLTTRMVGGTGTFDALMAGLNAQLKEQFDKNRITGADYAKAYVALTEAALSNATQFLLGREQAYWQAVAAQLQARTQEVALVTARVQLATAKAQLQEMSYQTKTAEAAYALTKAKLATEDIQFGVAKYNLDFMLPAQLNLVKEQMEAQRAQTMDKRSDETTTVVGVIGKQKDLYSQQITSYQRDAEAKAAKMFVDTWITQKSLDEALTAPTALQNATIDAVMSSIKTKNGL